MQNNNRESNNLWRTTKLFLSHFLFILWIIDLSTVCKENNLLIFAEDTTVCKKLPLPKDIERVCDWISTNKIINYDKLEAINSC